MNAAIVDDMATECEILRRLLKQYETNQQRIFSPLETVFTNFNLCSNMSI